MAARSLFAVVIEDGSVDDVLDLLDDVSQAGVDDDEWERLQFSDVRGDIYLVLRGTLRARGAFTSSSLVQVLTVDDAHAKSRDNRCTWRYPRDASEGVAIFDQWLDESGIEVRTEVVKAAIPKGGAATITTAPITLHGRDRAKPIPATPPRSAPATPPRERGSQAQGGRRAQPPVKRERNQVLDAFGVGSDEEFSLYREA